jgi:tetratricopeptide (TPR) repeat protein
MNRTLLFPMIWLLTVSLAAQTKPGGGGGGGGTGGTRPGSNTGTSSIPRRPDPRPNFPDTNPSVFYILGKVVPSDGSSLSDRAAIQSNCRGALKTEAYTDSKGNFSFDFGNNRNRVSEIGNASDSPGMAQFPNQTQRSTSRDLRDCQISAVLPGFASQIVDLAAKNPDMGHLDVGRIMVQRMGKIEGMTISAKPVPESARKDYFKGLEEKQKGKLDLARQKFQKAVEEYPQYASAWLELGRVQNAQNEPTSARQSFHQAITADSTFLPSYQELAQMAAHDKQWQELADTTDQMLKLDPNNYSQFWFYNGVAKYHLNKIDDAENSMVQGIKVDLAHRVPKLEYVLGLIRMQKGDRTGAAEHLHKYIAMVPTGPEAEDAQKKIQEVENASAATQVSKP